MANALGMNLGEVYRTAEAVKGSRQERDIKNKLMSWKTSDRAISEARRNKLLALKQDVATGQEGAMQALTLFDAGEAKEITDVLASADKNKYDQMVRTNDSMGRIMSSIRDAKNPAEQYARSRNYLAGVSPDLVKDMPEEYDPNFVEFGIGRATQMDRFLKNPQAVQFGGQDILYKGGQEVERAESGALKTAKAKAGAKGASKAADEALMYRQAGELLGGLFDQEGNLQNLDPTTRGKVQSIATEAARIFQKGGTRSDAVTKAARKLGISIEALEATGKTEGNALRVFNPATGKFD